MKQFEIISFLGCHLIFFLVLVYILKTKNNIHPFCKENKIFWWVKLQDMEDMFLKGKRVFFGLKQNHQLFQKKENEKNRKETYVDEKVAHGSWKMSLVQASLHVSKLSKTKRELFCVILNIWHSNIKSTRVLKIRNWFSIVEQQGFLQKLPCSYIFYFHRKLMCLLKSW